MRRAEKESAEPLWERIERNNAKLAFYIGVFIVAWAAGVEVAIVFPIAVFAWYLGLHSEQTGVFWPFMAWGGAVALMAGSIWAAFATTRSDGSVLAQLRAVRVPTGALPETKSALHDMSIAAGLPFPPPLFVLDTCSINAFVVGRKPESAVAGVTTGMLKSLPAAEQRAVFANLMARLRDGDVFVATVAASLMSPAWVWRNHDLDAHNDALFDPASAYGEERVAAAEAAAVRGAGPLLLAAGAMAFLGVFVTELLYAAQMQQQILTSEAADARGMMLLKEPHDMLAALERVVPEDNYVATAGSALAPLFFCWTGTAYIGEQDPEMRRVRRLRETLGAAAVGESGAS